MDANPNLSEKGKIDYALVQRALGNNDQTAYKELMNKYRDSVYYMLLKMVNNREDANDLTIETFAKAFENLEKYQPKFAFSTWLFRISTNNCIDFIRKKRLLTLSLDNTISGEDNDTSFDVAAKTMDPEERMMHQQKNQQVRDFVDQLPSRYRKLVILRYYEEKSYEEIAKELDVPLGTVKAQLFRSKNLLNNIIKKDK